MDSIINEMDKQIKALHSAKRHLYTHVIQADHHEYMERAEMRDACTMAHMVVVDRVLVEVS